jgi:DNA-binding IclR family transcriptional regulator
MGGQDTVRSDERLLAIVEALKGQDPVGVTDLAGALEMPKSTVHAHLSTLREAGYVARTEESEYRLGLAFLDVGMAARETRRIHGEVRTKLDELAEETAEKAWCVVEEGGEAVFLARAVGDRAIRTNARVGQHVPLHELAAGKAILASLPAERRREILDGYDYPLSGDRTREAVETELSEIRARGVAFGTEQFIRGVTGVAAPVTDTSGTVYGSITISGPSNRLTGDRLERELADLVRGTAGELQVNLSHGPST